jgi:hypothetical protein
VGLPGKFCDTIHPQEKFHGIGLLTEAKKLSHAAKLQSSLASATTIIFIRQACLDDCG